jgi:hypothetical protein
MAIRCMGQFVGREKAYSSINIFQNFKEIYERQGIGGFFVYVNLIVYIYIYIPLI